MIVLSNNGVAKTRMAPGLIDVPPRGAAGGEVGAQHRLPVGLRRLVRPLRQRALRMAVGRNRMPLEPFDHLRFNVDPTAAAIASPGIFVTFGVIFVIGRTAGLRALRV
jgi:hypothetical protein